MLERLEVGPVANTSTFAIDNTKTYEVRANTYCTEIKVQEEYDSDEPPTADLEQFVPFDGDPIKIAKGVPAIFSKGSSYRPKELVGGIKTVAGSISVQQRES